MTTDRAREPGEVRAANADRLARVAAVLRDMGDNAMMLGHPVSAGRLWAAASEVDDGWLVAISPGEPEDPHGLERVADSIAGSFSTAWIADASRSAIRLARAWSVLTVGGR